MPSNELLGSKVVITEVAPTIRSITALPTAVIAMVGITQSGPVGTPQFYSTFREWVAVYGAATADSLETWLAVQAYFAEGGSFLWFTRTAHYTDITDTATVTTDTAFEVAQTITALPAVIVGVNAAPFDFAPNDSITIEIDGGAGATATFAATQARDTAGNTGPYALVNGQTLIVEINGGAAQTVTFLTAQFVAIGAATAAEVAAVVNNALAGASSDVNTNAVRISSDTFGTDSSVEVTGGTAAAAFAFGGAAVGTGDVGNIDAVTFAEFAALLEADIAGLSVVDAGGGVPDLQTTATGAARTIEITASTGVQAVTGHGSGPESGSDGVPVDSLRFEARWPGAYGNDLVVRIANATSGEADRFNLIVLQDGIIRERFSNLSMVDDDPEGRYVETILETAGVGSRLITAEDQDAGGDQRPANGDYTLAGGADGLTSLADNDFIGSSVSLTGIRSFDPIEDITLLAIPARATAAVHNAMIQWCEVTKIGLVFAILEPPEALNAQSIIDYIEDNSLAGTTEYAAIYWPRVRVSNPNRAVFGQSDTVVSPVSGHIAGRMARTDASKPGGIYTTAAGLEFGQLRTVLGWEDDPDGGSRHQVLNPDVRDLVYPKRINPIARIGSAICIDGSKTLRGDGNFPGTGERRTVIFLETSIRSGIQFARHRDNTGELRREVERTIERFLLNQTRLGAFRSQIATEAFFVDVSDALNPVSVQAAGVLQVRVGFATKKSIDFVVVEVEQFLGPEEDSA